MERKSKSRTPFFAAVAGGCALLSCSTIPDTGRRSLNFIPASKEMEMGLSEFERYKQERQISTNRTQNAALQRVASRLTRVIPIRGASWEFVLFDDPEPNAFALPGGKVGVNTGIFQITRNDAGLAAVIGHEIAHVVARHGGERLSRGLIASGVGLGLDVALQQGGGLSTGQRAAVMSAYGVGSTLGGVLPFSRMQELEADQIGTLYMARAGYDPNEAVRFWQRFADYKSTRRRTPEMLSTHPLDSRRVAELQAFLPRAMQEYQGHQAPIGTPGAPMRAQPYRG